MKFGVLLPYTKDIATIAANVQQAEALGFESVWMGEHLGTAVKPKAAPPAAHPGANAPIDQPYLDPLMVFAYLAALTKKIRFATGVYVVPLRNPFALAKLIATLDQLSNGRFILGVGIGWSRDEFEWARMNFDDWALRTGEYLRLMTELWSSPNPIYQGKTVATENFKFEPKTIQQPRPPIVFGGRTEAAYKRAARLGDGWIGLTPAVGRLREEIPVIRKIEQSYRRAKPLEITAGAPPGALTLDSVRELKEMGVERTVVTSGGQADLRFVIERLHEQVISKL